MQHLERKQTGNQNGKHKACVHIALVLKTNCNCHENKPNCGNLEWSSLQKNPDAMKTPVTFNPIASSKWEMQKCFKVDGNSKKLQHNPKNVNLLIKTNFLATRHISSLVKKLRILTLTIQNAKFILHFVKALIQTPQRFQWWTLMFMLNKRCFEWHLFSFFRCTSSLSNTSTCQKVNF